MKKKMITRIHSYPMSKLWHRGSYCIWIPSHCWFAPWLGKSWSWTARNPLGKSWSWTARNPFSPENTDVRVDIRVE